MSEHPDIGTPNIQLNQLGMSRLEGHLMVPELLSTLELGLEKHIIRTNNPRAIELSSPFFLIKIYHIEFHVFDQDHIGQYFMFVTQYANGIHEILCNSGVGLHNIQQHTQHKNGLHHIELRYILNTFYVFGWVVCVF